ncbi:hypothetical protein [Streptacidiphilus carbonis]|uniref:hypothetical protein n=1 Tax=Streptacidiphilus carbonis TaxID=105422 RepID=UPI0005A972E2|nr:hypothetical protein [Streptacidiphilus carbonis]
MAQARFLIDSRPVVRTGTDAVSGERVGWRLVGANNRELGRGVPRFAEEQACREAVLRLRADMARAVVTVHRVQPGAMWAWRIAVDEVAAAASGRAYRRQRECQYNLAQFLAGVLLAELPRREPEFAQPPAEGPTGPAVAAPDAAGRGGAGGRPPGNRGAEAVAVLR